MTTRREYMREYMREYRKHKARPPTWRACSYCGKAIRGTARKQYCSAYCRVKAARARRK